MRSNSPLNDGPVVPVAAASGTPYSVAYAEDGISTMPGPASAIAHGPGGELPRFDDVSPPMFFPFPSTASAATPMYVSGITGEGSADGEGPRVREVLKEGEEGEEVGERRNCSEWVAATSPLDSQRSGGLSGMASLTSAAEKIRERG